VPCFVGVELGRGVHHLEERALDGRSGHALHDPSPNLTTTLDHGHDRDLAAPLLAGLAGVARLATNERLVGLDGTFQLAWRAGVGRHGEADTVHHEQRALVADARLPADLERANALLGRARAPERKAPDPKRDARVLEDSADADGELALAAMAAPEVADAPAPIAGRDLRHVEIAAPGAGGLTGPAKLLHELDSRALVRASGWNPPDDL
jgi:hypothetical protein